MAQETITQLIPEHTKIGTDARFESLDTPDELINHIDKSIEGLERMHLRKDVLGQALGHNLVELLVYENNKLKDDPKKLQEKTSAILWTARTYAHRKNENPNVFLNGYMAEACVALSLNELGYTVLSSSQEEDVEGKIDMFVIDKNVTNENPFILAVQVKNSQEVRNLVTYDLNEDLKKLTLILEGEPIKEFYEFKNKLSYSKNCMIEYLSRNATRYKGRVIPILLIVPGGDDAENSSYNTNTATPVKGFSYELFDKLDPIIYKGEK